MNSIYIKVVVGTEDFGAKLTLPMSIAEEDYQQFKSKVSAKELGSQIFPWLDGATYEYISKEEYDMYYSDNAEVLQ